MWERRKCQNNDNNISELPDLYTLQWLARSGRCQSSEAVAGGIALNWSTFALARAEVNPVDDAVLYEHLEPEPVSIRGLQYS